MESSELMIKVNLSRKDILRFQISYFVRQWYAWLFSLLFIISGYTMINKISTGGSLSEVPNQAWIFVLFYIAFFILLLTNSKKSLNNRFINEEKKYRFSQENIWLESESTTQRMNWNDVQKYIITKNAIYLFVSSNSAHVIPFRSLSSEQTDQLIRLVTVKIHHKQKKNVLGILFIALLSFVLVVEIIQYILR